MENRTDAFLYPGEPRLRELLDDPLVHMVMARDGVYPSEVLALVQDVARRRANQCEERRAVA
ncbi:hypothetical protein HHL28_00325 [Aerophototrophica crusticola]|uniref:Uncharacterized protein n=1 Tax=Aerophototrophica crusticola TaxID=1709002 RepID=A0A858R3I5_9PROT|nr:hypothetical protein HHL28_00325 [Rhodospirillaceae bacterium B3]